MELSVLQEEQKEFQDRNFPNTKPYQCLLGMIEELGELSHAHLKCEQGIRVNEDHEAKRKDAVGDIVIYTSGHCNIHGYNLDVCVKDVERIESKTPIDYDDVEPWVHILNMSYTMGCLKCDPRSKHDGSRIGSIVTMLKRYCTAMKIDFDSCVKTAWNEVKNRDWKKNKVNGTEP